MSSYFRILWNICNLLLNFIIFVFYKINHLVEICLLMMHYPIIYTPISETPTIQFLGDSKCWVFRDFRKYFYLVSE